MIYSSDLFTYC